MKISALVLLAAAGLARPLAAQIPNFGVTAEDCATYVDNTAERAELYAVKIPSGGSCTDLEFDLRTTGGAASCLASVGDASALQWSLPPNWRNPQAGSDVTFVVLVYPPVAPGLGNRVMLDTGATLNQDFGAAIRQTIGNSIPLYAGAVPQSIELTLPGSAERYDVRLDGPGSRPTPFPQGASGGIELAFAPLAEVNTIDPSGLGFCAIAGDATNPDVMAQGGGAILGYNVYRLAGDPAVVPTAADFYAASIDADASTGWQYFLPLTSSFDLRVPDPVTIPGLPGNDQRPNDLGGLQNPDGVMYSGDEVMIFQDSAANRGVPRLSGTAPDLSGTIGYWYAFQPVLCGSVSDFADIGFCNGSAAFPGDHRVDLVPGGGPDSVDLDLDGRIELFSPQADAGQPGLGLTWSHLPALSSPVFGRASPAAARGHVDFTATVAGTRVDITMRPGIEDGTVAGYVIEREGPGGPVRVTDQPILSTGLEGATFELVDRLPGTMRRLGRTGALVYRVVVLKTDGEQEVLGPFKVVGAGVRPGQGKR